MTLRRKLTLRYAAIVGVCLVLLAGLAHHEFVTEPAQRKALGIPELPETWWSEYAEVFFYGMIPFVLGCGWWVMRRSLKPLDHLASELARVDVDRLGERLTPPGSADELDKVSAAFNVMAERLEKSFQQIREFTLHASHELKTPLTIMRAELGAALRDEPAPTPAQRERLGSVLDEVQRLARIVDGLTLLTKADAGLATLERQPVQLDQLVRECFEDAAILAEPAKVRVELLRREPVVVMGDWGRLRQLLLNLTDNAIKYNRPDGRVTLALWRADGDAALEITNTGEGIPADLQPRVFDRFVRGDGARSKAGDGCGLGLTIVRWIVQAHGGTIELTSRPGETTTVSVRLPLAARPWVKEELTRSSQDIRSDS
jgi:signal transduction histidine kinase